MNRRWFAAAGFDLYDAAVTFASAQHATGGDGALVNARYVAERVGFEPTVPCGTPDFESGTFDHSATSPGSIFAGRNR